MNNHVHKFLLPNSQFETAYSCLSLWVRHHYQRFLMSLPSLSKRLLDIVVSIAALIVLSPVFIITWLLIRREDGGAALFRQQRIGKWGEPFAMYKYRSMHLNAESMRDELESANESAAGVIFKIKQDPRITKVGHYIRKLSIDELPQLYNVLIGDMSLVGPRPALPSEVEAYSLHERRRLDAAPGITCLWQVGGRSDIDFEGQVKLDIQYIREQNLLKDLIILSKTIPAVISGKGAY